jgi:histidinol dehydrogenase
VQKQVECLPRREIALTALSQSRALLVASIDEALEVSNQYAPEHLILQVKDPQQALLKVKNAGSVFLGPWSPEAVGDYASGTNHVLPTAGYARSVSGLGVESFMKAITVQELKPNGLRGLGPSVELLAETETLKAHRQAVSLRLQALEGEK